MSPGFDEYRDDYEDHVNRAISFSGLKHDFFTRAKAAVFRELAARRFETSSSAPRILDIGCGPGAIHPLIAAGDAPLTGVDVATQLLRRARVANPSFDYVAYDGRRLPFGDCRFDIVVTICVMHHVAPKEWPAFVKEMHRVTSQGGLALVFEHNPYNPLTRLVVNRCAFDKDAVLLASGTAARLLKEAGFSHPSCRFLLVAPFENKLFERLDRALGRLPLGAQYVVSAGKQ